MKKLLIFVAVVAAPFMLAEDTQSKSAIAVKDSPKVAEPYVLTVKEKLARLEYIDVTSEKELIEDSSTELAPELEAILKQAEEAEKE